MKTLQNNFTTPEQSKRLLEIGVPADSADCYYVTRNNYTAILHNELFTKCRDEMIKVSKTAYRVKMHDDDVLPCWSVGRLIDIYMIAAGLQWIDLCLPNDFTESIVKMFVGTKDLDFLKLED